MEWKETFPKQPGNELQGIVYLNKDETCWIHGSQTMLIQVHVQYMYTILNNTMLNNILDHKKTNSIFEYIALRQ